MQRPLAVHGPFFQLAHLAVDGDTVCVAHPGGGAVIFEGEERGAVRVDGVCSGLHFVDVVLVR